MSITILALPLKIAPRVSQSDELSSVAKLMGAEQTVLMSLENVIVSFRIMTFSMRGSASLHDRVLLMPSEDGNK